MAKKRKAARRTRRSGVGSQIHVDELVRLQQDSIRRAFDFWANSATRLSHGNFSLSEWSREYESVVEESLDDYGQVLKKMFGTR